MNGYAAPRDPTGSATLYGRPPWRFAGRSLTVIARCHADAVAALVPAPLEPWGEPLVRFSVHWLQCDLGLGPDFVHAHPERAQFHEAVVGIAVKHGDTTGYWDPFLWCDSDAEIAVGREMFGWPQRAGTIALSQPHPQDGWALGQRPSACVGRLGRAVFEASVTLARAGDLDLPAPPFVEFFTERILPDPVSGGAVRELYASEMREMRIADRFSGPATLALHAPELLPLRPCEPLGGRINTVSWIKDRSRLVARSEEHA